MQSQRSEPEFPDFFAALDRLHRQQVLHPKTARRVASKAGLESNTTPHDRPARTILYAFLHLWSGMGTNNYQWSVDLTGITEIRLTANVVDPIWLWYSPTTEGALDPGDFQPIMTPGEVVPHAKGYITTPDAPTPTDDRISLGWLTLPPEYRTPARIAFADHATPGDPVQMIGAQGAVMLQGR